ncbi:hypothetical protein BD770DRAFT_409495 [Pilaira anomala]|nr:hypothetical protein BD770DRAFT_409495 [Pilaira anomala]
MSHCIWGFLSAKDLEFVYTSSYDKLRGYSLFELIHPDEVLLAKRDLYKFMDSSLLGGSVTRCRLIDYSNNTFITSTPNYIVVDIIMYVATENLVLAFFHRQQDVSVCGDHNFCTSKKNSLFYQLKSISSTTTTTTPPPPPTDQLYHYYNAPKPSSPHQFFHILDNRTKSVLLSWPDHYPNEMDGAQMHILDDRPMSPGVSCFHCVRQTIRTTISGQKINSFIIEYGSIAFVLIQVKKSVSLPSSPLYDYKRLDPIKKNRSSTTFNKLENLLLPVNINNNNNNNNNNKQQHIHHQRNHCQSCGTDSSPEWRRGPTGHKTLCNACGLRYSRSVARQVKIALNQQKQQQHSIFQSQDTPHTSPKSKSSSPSYSYNRDVLKMNYQPYFINNSNDNHHLITLSFPVTTTIHLTIPFFSPKLFQSNICCHIPLVLSFL